MRQLPHLQEVHETYRNRGLHVFQVEAQRHSEAEIALSLRPFGITFANAQASWSDVPLLPHDTKYADYAYSAGALPSTYLIGVDGTVVWHGTANYDEAIEAELKKVRYPGLFRAEFPAELEDAAQSFGARRYGAATTAARKAMDRHANDAAIADAAQHILALADEVHQWRMGKVDDLVDERSFTDAIDHLDATATEFAGDPRADAASARAKKLRADSAVQVELKIDASREALFDAYAGLSRRERDPAKFVADLKKLAERHPDTGAAERAESLASDFEL